MKKCTPVILIHVIAWALFLSLPTMFKPMRPGEDIFQDFYAPGRLLNGALVVGVFYFNYYIAIPRLYLQGRYVPFALTGVGALVLLYLLNGMLLPAMHMGPGFGPGGPGGPGFGPAPGGPGPGSFRGPGFGGPGGGPPRQAFTILGPSHNLFMFIIGYVVSFGVRMYRQYQQTMEEKLNSEISFLKAQINPHFLFNTLNSIYSLSLTKSDSTPEAVLKLSEIMRFTTSEAHLTHVALEKEIAYISSYIDLQKLRLHPRSKVFYSLEGRLTGRQIAPFILIPFVENAFKYGVNPNEDSQISIRITTGIDHLDLEVSNTKVFIKPSREDSTGLGIRNTRRRLDLLYPGKHTLTIDDTRDLFRVFLHLDLS